MPYHVFFSFSTGLVKPMYVPKGTRDKMLAHVQNVTEKLSLTVTKYKDNPAHWDKENIGEGLSDDDFCEYVTGHNVMVRWFYDLLGSCSGGKTKDGDETLTPDQADEFWHGLELLSVPPDRWTEGYYEDRMEHLYEVMRGRDSEGVSFGDKALTPKQAEAVVILFSEFLDPGDTRLAVTEGSDHLTTEYAWCSLCGAIAHDEIDYKVRYCRKRGGCDIRKEYGSDR